MNLSIEDKQHLFNNSTNNKNTSYDSEDYLFDLETLDVILFDYEELSKNFELIEICSAMKSDIVHTTTGADYLVPLGRVLNIQLQRHLKVLR